MANQINNTFSSSQEHLFAELKRVGLKLELLLATTGENESTSPDDEFRGLYVSDDYLANSSLKKPFGLDRPVKSNTAAREIEKKLEILDKEISNRKQKSLETGVPLKLEKLRRLFNLSQFDVDTVLLSLLPELDVKYQQTYAYLQDDITRKSPGVDLVLRLLCETFEESIARREAFSPCSPLIKYRLLNLFETQSPVPSLLLNRSLKADERTVNFLMGSNQPDDKLASIATIDQPVDGLDALIFAADFKQPLVNLSKETKERETIFRLIGPSGTGKHATAEAFCAGWGIPLLTIETGKLPSFESSLIELLPLIFREGRLQGAALYFNNFDIWPGNEKIGELLDTYLAGELRIYPGWIFLAGEKDFPLKNSAWSKPLINIEFPAPAFYERKLLWEKYWDLGSGMPDGLDFSDLAGAFRLTGGQIRDAIAAAKNLATWRDPANTRITTDDVYAACRKQFRGTLNTLAHKVKPNYAWKDIVLPKDQLDQLHEICGYMKHYNRVYGDWGFGRRVSLGKGLNVLFSGPSGTGKTMSAEILANELRLDLYKIDLSMIVSKYIGETEKNLDRIFREGQTSNAILFFDEADAIFGKRSEVRDSHDRYANVEIAYLLQKMEEYDGIVILATNLRKNMDEAFARRMHFVLEFPIPEEPYRFLIWKGIFPAEAPLSNTVDLKFMARQFKISGGNIKNIAFSAAFLAADNGGAITMEHLIRATKREYQKTGKLCTEGDFGEYFELVKV